MSGKKAELPWKLNNANLPYFRPIFQQISASCGQSSGIAEGELAENNLHFEVFPNPFKNSLKMKFYSNGEENAIFRIFDLHGRLIKMESIFFNYPGQSVEMSWEGNNEKGEKQLSGIYFVNYIAGKQSSTQKVILR